MTLFVRTASQVSPRRSSGVLLLQSNGLTATRSRGMGRPTSNRCRWYVPRDGSGEEQYMIRDETIIFTPQGRSIINPNFLRAYYIHWGSVLPGQEISHPHGKCMFLLHLFRLVSHKLGIYLFRFIFLNLKASCLATVYPRTQYLKQYCLAYLFAA